MRHHSHPTFVARLKRAEGHLRSILGMLQAERSCLDIAQQLHAVEAAIASAKRELIQDHLEHCLEDGVRSGEMDVSDAMRELKSLAKYLG